MGFAETFHRGVPHDGLHAVAGEDFAVLFGREKARDEGVDPDLLGRPFAGEVLGQVVEGTFGGAICENAREGIEAGDGAEVDDAGRFAALGNTCRRFGRR